MKKSLRIHGAVYRGYKWHEDLIIEVAESGDEENIRFSSTSDNGISTSLDIDPDAIPDIIEFLGNLKGRF